MKEKLRKRWERFWMGFAGLSRSGRLATRLASFWTPPHTGRYYLARITTRPYLDPRATIHHAALNIAQHVFVAEHATIYQAKGGAAISLGENAHVLRDCILETGQGGSLKIGADTFLHPRCQVMAYKGDIVIGDHVAIAPNCALYSYNHTMARGEIIKRQPLTTRGGITIGDDAWLGVGVIVLDGVSIGSGAVIGAGSVVTADVPDNAIAVGNPARVISTRTDVELAG